MRPHFSVNRHLTMGSQLESGSPDRSRGYPREYDQLSLLMAEKTKEKGGEELSGNFCCNMGL